MTMPFTPVFRDGRPAADLIAELVQGKPYGHELTYQEIADQLGIDVSERERIHAAVQRAKPRLLRECLRAVEARPGTGYEILHPGKNAGLATRYKKKSDRSIKRAISVVRGADERDMSDAERERNRAMGMVLERLHERQQDVEARVSRLESLMLGAGPKVIPGTVETVMRELETAEG